MSNVTVENDRLRFRFPEVHEEAEVRVSFQRTLRIPDDDKTHYLPLGLGLFPLRNVDDHIARIPARWAERGGVMLPMYQSEALWISFEASASPAYCFALKVSTGGICALTGERTSSGLARTPQNYLVLPHQPWLDGFNVGGDTVRQFVAVPLDDALSVEHQIKGGASKGGMDLEVIPMKAEAWVRYRSTLSSLVMLGEDLGAAGGCAPDMGFAAGGKMRQEIYEDEYLPEDWSSASATCRINVCNSLAWRAITHETPPTQPPGPKEYQQAGFPFFDYYDDRKIISGSKVLGALKSYRQGNESVEFSPERIVALRSARGLKAHGVRVVEKTGNERSS